MVAAGPFYLSIYLSTYLSIFLSFSLSVLLPFQKITLTGKAINELIENGNNK